MLDPAWCAAVLTAAGASRRMGTPKALVRYRDRPLLLHQLEALEGFGQRIVVLGNGATEIREAVTLPPEVVVVENPDWEQGRSGSLRRGFGAVSRSAGAILVSGVDQPLDPAVIALLLAALDPSEQAYAVPLVGERAGHPILFAGALLPILVELGDAETLRDVAARYRDAALRVPVSSDLPLKDFNRREDMISGPDPV